MKNMKKYLAGLMAFTMVAGLTACGGGDTTTSGGGNAGGAQDVIDEAREEETTTTTTAKTVAEINTEELKEDEATALEDIMTQLQDVEMENKTVKWLAHYDINPSTATGASKSVALEMFEKKYGGEIEYIPTTWATQFDELSTSILGGDGVDFFPAPEAIPKCAINGMTQPYDQYIDWENPLWQSVKAINDQFLIGDDHYLMVAQVSPGYVVYYNKQTIESMGLDDPNELYANGEWTLSKFKEMLLEFVDNEAELYGLDGWFNCTPLYLATGVPSVSLKDGKLSNNLSDPAFERAMTFQYELNKNGLILDKSLFNWTPQIQYIGEGKELFYIGGLYEIESAPEIWTKTFGDAEDVFFVPVPKDEEADKYYYNAEFDCYNLCVGAQNPEGVARLIECVIASYYDENTIRINEDKLRNDYGWADEMIEMKKEVARLTQENPVRDVYGGLSTDLSQIIGDSFNMPLQGTDWYTVRESVNDTVESMIGEINAQIDALE